MSLALGAIVEGTVSGITNFGAFIELPGGQVGLVHISEIADAYVKDIREYLKEKDRVNVKVISIDGKGKIGLSIKQAQSTRGRSRSPESYRAARMSFEDKLAKFLKESDEKQTDLRRSTDAKRGGRGSPRRFDSE